MGGSAHLSMSLAAVSLGATGAAYTKGCPASLAGGAATTLGMGLSAYLIQDGQDFAGHAVGSAVSGFTTFFMGRRWLSLRHPFMPNGLLACSSAVGFLYNTYKANEWLDSW